MESDLVAIAISFQENPLSLRVEIKKKKKISLDKMDAKLKLLLRISLPYQLNWQEDLQ